jgi:hypothetical protein
MNRISYALLGGVLAHIVFFGAGPSLAEDLFKGNNISVNYDNTQCYPNGKCITTAYVHTYRFTKDGSLFSYRRNGGGVHFRPNQKSSTDKSVEKLNGHSVPIYTRSTYSISGNRFKIKDITRITYNQKVMPQLPVERGDAYQTIDIQLRVDGKKCTVATVKNHLKMPAGGVINRQWTSNARCKISR